MPLYEYQCGRCGRFELIQKFSDAALKVCPTCGGEVQKLLSAPAIQFKGAGWYVTDYAKKSSGGKDGESKSSESASSSSGDKGGASKEGSSSSDKSKSKDGSGSGSSPAK